MKSVVYRCVICRRYKGKSFTPPQSPPLPSFRVNKAPPFLYTAVDFAGPIFVQGLDLSLSTCGVIRAVHLEFVGAMLVITLIRCLKRFTARMLDHAHSLLSFSFLTFSYGGGTRIIRHVASLVSDHAGCSLVN